MFVKPVRLHVFVVAVLLLLQSPSRAAELGQLVGQEASGKVVLYGS